MVVPSLRPLPSHWIDAAPLCGWGGSVRSAEIDARARAADPAWLAARLGEVIAANPGAALVAPLIGPFVAAWNLIPRVQRPPLWLVLPDVRGLVREATEFGMVGAGLRRVLRIGPIGMLRLGFASLPDGPGVLRRDFPAMLRVLCRLEMAGSARLGAEGFFLQPQMTDLALSLGAMSIIEGALSIGARNGLRLGLATSNSHALAAALAGPSPRLANLLTGGLTVLAPRGGFGTLALPAGVVVVAPAPISAPAPRTTAQSSMQPDDSDALASEEAAWSAA